MYDIIEELRTRMRKFHSRRLLPEVARKAGVSVSRTYIWADRPTENMKVSTIRKLHDAMDQVEPNL